VLDGSNYTEMWQKDRSADAADRLENLKGSCARGVREPARLPRTISLVMDADGGTNADAVSIMTMHSAKRLNSTPCSCPAGRKDCSRSARSTTRDAPGSKRSAASPRRPHARARRTHLFRLQPPHARPVANQLPSRFLDELPKRMS
jgi:DNA helicase-2/ATP-dependent DNA helicase PcrA